MSINLLESGELNALQLDFRRYKSGAINDEEDESKHSDETSSLEKYQSAVSNMGNQICQRSSLDTFNTAKDDSSV